MPISEAIQDNLYIQAELYRAIQEHPREEGVFFMDEDEIEIVNNEINKPTEIYSLFNPIPQLNINEEIIIPDDSIFLPESYSFSTSLSDLNSLSGEDQEIVIHSI